MDSLDLFRLPPEKVRGGWLAGGGAFRLSEARLGACRGLGLHTGQSLLEPVGRGHSADPRALGWSLSMGWKGECSLPLALVRP